MSNRQQWLEKRRRHIGASDAASALGISPWKSKLALWAEKTGTVEADDISDKPAVRWGSLLEPVIREEVGRILKQTVTDPGEYTVITNPQRLFMSATLDGILQWTPTVEEVFLDAGIEDMEGGDGTLQIKTTSAFNANEWAEIGSWPLHYQIQCAHELAVAGYDWGILAVLIGGQDLRLLPFVRHEAFEAAMIRVETVFWKHVEDKTEPPVDGSVSTQQTLSRMFPADTGEEIDLPAESILWDAARQEANVIIKRQKDVVADCDAKLKHAIGDASVGITPDGVQYSWKLQQRKAFTVKASESRVLRRKKA